MEPMDSQKLHDWIQIVGIVAVVASLIFVGLELRQEQGLARADLGSQSFQMAADLHLSLSDPDLARAWTKMLESPDRLTTQERHQVDSVLHAAKTLFMRECYLTDRGVFAECRGLVLNIGPVFFGSEYAQTWWRTQRGDEPILPDWIDEQITNIRAGNVP